MAGSLKSRLARLIERQEAEAMHDGETLILPLEDRYEYPRFAIQLVPRRMGRKAGLLWLMKGENGEASPQLEGRSGSCDDIQKRSFQDFFSGVRLLESSSEASELAESLDFGPGLLICRTLDETNREPRPHYFLHAVPMAVIFARGPLRPVPYEPKADAQ